MGLRALLGLTATAVVGWCAVTMGWVAATGDLPAALTLSAFAVLSPMMAATALFIGGVAVAMVLVYVLGALGLGLRRRSVVRS